MNSAWVSTGGGGRSLIPYLYGHKVPAVQPSSREAKTAAWVRRSRPSFARMFDM